MCLEPIPNTQVGGSRWGATLQSHLRDTLLQASCVSTQSRREDRPPLAHTALPPSVGKRQKGVDADLGWAGCMLLTRSPAQAVVII